MSAGRGPSQTGARERGSATEPPSERRLRQARRQGLVPVSPELVALCALVGAAAAFSLTGPLLYRRLHGLMQESLTQAAGASLQAARALLQQGLTVLLGCVGPMLAAALCGAWAAGLAQTRGLLTLNPLRPDLGRLGRRSRDQGAAAHHLGWVLGDLLVAMAAALVTLLTLVEHAPFILATLGRVPQEAAASVGCAMGALILRLGLLFALKAGVDLLLRRAMHRRRLRMTRAESRREQREQEGDPAYRARRRQIHHSLLAGSRPRALGEADRVVVRMERDRAGERPSLAVALRFDEVTMEAPELVDKGREEQAREMLKTARELLIPVNVDTELAEDLARLRPGQTIGPELYEAVAALYSKGPAGPN